MNLDSLIQNWRIRPLYEQTILGFIILSAVILFIYLLLIQPLAGHYRDAENNLKAAKREAQLITGAVKQVRLLRGRVQSPLPNDEEELRNWVANSAREAQVNVTSFLLLSSEYIEIHVKEVEPAALFNWLDQLTSSHGLLINRATLTPTKEAGLLNADIRLDLQ